MKSLLVALALAFTPTLPAAERPPEVVRFSIHFMDRSTRPGSDFFRYACGGWIDGNTIPADKTMWGPWSQTEELVWFQLRQILTTAAEEKAGRVPACRQVGDFYASGIDTARRNALTFLPVAEDLARISALREKTELPALLAALHLRGIGGFFDAGVNPDEKDSSRYAFHLSQSDDAVGLPDREYFLAKGFADIRAAYRQHVVRMFTLAGVATPARAAEAVLRLETALAKAALPREQLQDSLKNYHALSPAELAAAAPDFAWDAYIRALGVDPPARLIVGQPDVLRSVSTLLKAEPLDDWKTYLRWRVLSAAAPYLHEAADGEHFSFYGRLLEGRREQSPSWRRVTRVVDDSMGEALGKLYVEQYFPPASKARVEEMMGFFKDAFRERLRKVPWMTEPTREAARAKLERFVGKVGYPGKFRDYAGLEVRRDDFLGNVQRATAWEWKRSLARIGQPVDRTEWACSPPTVNAFFMPTENSITLPAGILQPPMFDPAMDDAVNYGNIGATIGHEMTHGFDSDGRQYDGDGNLADWWTKADAKQFQSRAQKLVEQFNALAPLPGAHINGRLTLAENLADLGGLVIAWDALQKALAADPAKRQPIDGLTPEQRFFISYAQSWCVIVREEYLRQQLLTDVHAPAEQRAYAPLLHMPEFYRAFGIEKGAKLWLPPAKRAVIW